MPLYFHAISQRVFLIYFIFFSTKSPLINRQIVKKTTKYILHFLLFLNRF